MKLYSTVTTERGKPQGKGGNKEIEVRLNVGSASKPREIAVITLTAIGDTYYLVVSTANYGVGALEEEGDI